MQKKIAIIGLKGLPAFGGAARAGESLIKSLESRYDFTVYAVASHTNKAGLYNGFKQIVFKESFIKKLNIFLYYLKSALHCLFKGDYDLIHINHIDGAFIIPLLRIKYKIIATSRGQPQKVDKWNKLEKKYFLIMEKIFLKYSNLITVVSKPLYEYYKEIINDKNKLFYIPNGIILEDINPEKIDDKDYLLFAAGRILEIKGCHLLLEALKRINFNGKVLILGNMDHNLSYKEQLLSLSNSLNVKFIGLIKSKNKLFNYIKQAKFFVFPSLVEAMSNMLLEVASQQVPIICSDIPENESIFNDNEVLFFKSNNVNDLSERLRWALANENYMKIKAQKAYENVKKNYLWVDIAKKYDLLYQNLISS